MKNPRLQTLCVDSVLLFFVRIHWTFAKKRRERQQRQNLAEVKALSLFAPAKGQKTTGGKYRELIAITLWFFSFF